MTCWFLRSTSKLRYYYYLYFGNKKCPGGIFAERYVCNCSFWVFLDKVTRNTSGDKSWMNHIKSRKYVRISFGTLVNYYCHWRSISAAAGLVLLGTLRKRWTFARLCVPSSVIILHVVIITLNNSKVLVRHPRLIFRDLENFSHGFEVANCCTTVAIVAVVLSFRYHPVGFECALLVYLDYLFLFGVLRVLSILWLVICVQGAHWYPFEQCIHLEQPKWCWLENLIGSGLQLLSSF